jgi:hypothetical protein
MPSCARFPRPAHVAAWQHPAARALHLVILGTPSQSRGVEFTYERFREASPGESRGVMASHQGPGAVQACPNGRVCPAHIPHHFPVTDRADYCVSWLGGLNQKRWLHSSHRENLDMIAKHKQWMFALVALAAVAALASNASAQCATCGVPAVASYAPATYSVGYAPVAYTTAYAPATTGWYPGYYMDRIRANWWSRRAATTAYYPTTYAVGYAPTAAYASYAPAVSYASYAPAVSGCSTCTVGYAPACSTCSACTVSYAPACPGCAVGCADCAPATMVTQASYVEPAGCPTCAGGSTTSTPTYSMPSQTATPQPQIAPSESVPSERTYQETQRPIEPEPATQPEPAMQPEPAGDVSEESAKFEAPQLFNPSDRTAELHQAPVRTAVYHKPLGSAPSKVQTVSHRQAELDADGWVSASQR